MLWITDNADEKFNEAVTDVFDSVFLQKIDAEGDSVDTPKDLTSSATVFTRRKIRDL